MLKAPLNLNQQTL